MAAGRHLWTRSRPLFINHTMKGLATLMLKPFRPERRLRHCLISAEKDNFSGSLRTLTKHKDEALLGLAVNNPRFDVAPLEKNALPWPHGSASNSGTIASETWWQNALDGHACQFHAGYAGSYPKNKFEYVA